MKNSKHSLIAILGTILAVVVTVVLLGGTRMLQVADTGEEDGKIYGAVSEADRDRAITGLPEPGSYEATLTYLWYSEAGGHEFFFSDAVEEGTRTKVEQQVRKLEKEGYEVGFVLFDFNTGNAITYNTATKFYPASTIKAHYAVSLVNGLPETLDYLEVYFADLLMNSSNEAYQYLADTYGFSYLAQWCRNAGVSPSIAENMYINMTTMDGACLWAESYYWFEQNSNGQRLGALFESPWKSLINEAVPEGIVTRTKAGWIDGVPGVIDDNQTGDGGIIYDGDHPYMLVLFTSIPDDFDLAAPLTKALVDAHKDLID